MKTKLLSSTIVLAAFMAVASAPDDVLAYDGVWCADGDHMTSPECGGGAQSSAPWAEWKRVTTGCDVTITVNNVSTTSTIGLEFSYSAQAPYSGKYPPVLLLQGGGTVGAFTDPHGDPANPYQELARGLALLSMIAIQPYWATGPGSMPWDDADIATQVLGCVAARTDLQTCATHKYGCIAELTDRISWGPTNMQNMIIVGHSNGGVVSLYMPEKLDPVGGDVGLRAVIMIDPAKDDYLAKVPRSLASNTTLVHIYPDFYGPLRNQVCNDPAKTPCKTDNQCTAPYTCSGGNQLFRLGANASCINGTSAGLGCVTNSDCPGGSCTGPAPVKGNWIPLGIRDSPGALALGKRDSQHCLALEERSAWNYNQPDPAHYPYANGTKPPPSGACPSGSTCGQASVCYANGALKKNGDPTGWVDGTSRNILHRYVMGYAACLSADYGVYYQPWVTGSDRAVDDASGAAFCEVGLRPQGAGGGGNPNPICSLNTNVLDCWNANCHWVAASSYKAIRINNGTTNVNDYGSASYRWYGTYEGIANNGNFNERQERNGVVCNAGIANF